mmetsp:Transcript_7241/g.17702  ORF Transcript_7241/g.17702 Transcript_7241/m.17702 type:complete len:226 (-) Transcript_7241:231-908(-)
MPSRIQQHIVGFNVPVDVPQGVDAANGVGGLRHEKPCNTFRKGVLLDEQTHEITPRQEFHDHVQMRLVHKGIIQGSQPFVFRARLAESLPLGPHMPHLVLQNHHFLLHAFEGKDLDRFVAFGFASHESDLPKGSAANDCQRFKIRRRDLLAGFLLDEHFFVLEVSTELLLFVFGHANHSAFELHFPALFGFLLSFETHVTLRKKFLGSVRTFFHFLVCRSDGFFV